MYPRSAMKRSRMTNSKTPVIQTKQPSDTKPKLKLLTVSPPSPTLDDLPPPYSSPILASTTMHSAPPKATLYELEQANRDLDIQLGDLQLKNLKDAARIAQMKMENAKAWGHAYKGTVMESATLEYEVAAKSVENFERMLNEKRMERKAAEEVMNGRKALGLKIVSWK